MTRLLPRRFWPWFETVIRDAVRRRVEELTPPPLPDRPGRVTLAGGGFRPIPNLKEFCALTQRVEGARIRGDVVGYVSEGAVVILNGLGHPMDEQPPAASLTVTITDPAVLEAAYLTDDRRVVIVGKDAMPTGTPWEIRISAVETGEEDDLVISGLYDPDRPGSVDTGNMGNLVAVTELPPPAGSGTTAPAAPPEPPDPA